MILRFNKFLESHQDEIDRILDKINKSGIRSLTKIEKQILDNYGNKKELDKIINQNIVEIKGSKFQFSHDKNEIHGEEFRVWGNLLVDSDKFYGYLEGFPKEVGGDGFESYVFSLKNDLHYGIEQEDIDIPMRYHLMDYLELHVGFMTEDHESFCDFLSRIWDIQKEESWSKDKVEEWFKKRGLRYKTK